MFAEVRNGPDSMLRNPSAGSFRDRWDSKDDFTDDLIAYVFWSHHLTLHAEARRHVVQELTDHSQSVAAALEEAAYVNLKLAVDPSTPEPGWPGSPCNRWPPPTPPSARLATLSTNT